MSHVAAGFLMNKLVGGGR
jgi:cytochrome c-type biogenesis protein CcmH/NrfF